MGDKMGDKKEDKVDVSFASCCGIVLHVVHNSLRVAHNSLFNSPFNSQQAKLANVE